MAPPGSAPPLSDIPVTLHVPPEVSTTTVEKVKTPKMTLRTSADIPLRPPLIPGWTSELVWYPSDVYIERKGQGFIFCKPGDGPKEQGYGLLQNPDGYLIIESADKSERFYSPEGKSVIAAATTEAYTAWQREIAKPRADDPGDPGELVKSSYTIQVKAE
jgi:hypothetical protein